MPPSRDHDIDTRLPSSLDTGPSANYVGVVVAHAHGRMSYLARKAIAPTVRVGWHTIAVREYRGTLRISLDGHLVLVVPTALPSQAWLGFTGATGRSYEWNEVKAAAITVS